jgi:DNA-binding NarL/FixJ family response regulator
MTDNEVSELRASAMRGALTLASTESCAALWAKLVHHELEIRARFTTADREYLVLGPATVRSGALCGRRLQILESVLWGTGRKAMAYDLGISPSTVAQALSAALRDMGLACSPARIPPLLVVLAHAARGDRVGTGIAAGRFEHAGRSFVVVAKEIDCPLFRVLAPAQRAVLRQVIHGSSYADIAARRRTSSRTVANQVAAACRRLGVSGRSDLVQFVVSARTPREPGALVAAMP